MCFQPSGSVRWPEFESRVCAPDLLTWSIPQSIDSSINSWISLLVCQLSDLLTRSSPIDFAWPFTRWLNLSHSIGWLDQITIRFDYLGIFSIFKHEKSKKKILKNPKKFWKNKRKIIVKKKKLKACIFNTWWSRRLSDLVLVILDKSRTRSNR